MSNGYAISKLLNKIDDNAFTIQGVDEPNQHWGIKLANLKKITLLIQCYLDKIDIKMPSINLEEIAQNESIPNIIKLCELLPLIAVKCPNRNTFIQNMLSFEECIQVSLMNIVSQYTKDERSPETNKSFKTDISHYEEEICKLEEQHKLEVQKQIELNYELEVSKKQIENLLNKQNEFTEQSKILFKRKSSCDVHSYANQEINTLQQTIVQLKYDHGIQIELLKLENNTLKEENSVISEKVVSMSKEIELIAVLKEKLDCFDSITQQYEEMKAIIDDGSNKIITLEAKLKESQELNDSYKKTIKESIESKQSANVFEANLQQKAEELKVALKNLLDERNKVKKLCELMKKQNDDIATLKTQKTKISDSIEDDQKILELQKTIESIKKENSVLKLNNTDSSNSELGLKYFALLEENRKQALIIESYAEQIKHTNTKMKQQESEMLIASNAQMNIMELQIEGTALNNKNETLCKKLECLQTISQQLESAKEENTQLKKNKETIQNELNQVYHDKIALDSKYSNIQEEKMESYKKEKEMEFELIRVKEQLLSYKAKESLIKNGEINPVSPMISGPVVKGSEGVSKMEEEMSKIRNCLEDRERQVLLEERLLSSTFHKMFTLPELRLKREQKKKH